MEIKPLLRQARQIWGEARLDSAQIIIRLGTIFGDICRWQRDATYDKPRHTDYELKKELGNVIFSSIRWCDDLGFDPEECIQIAVDAQTKFKEENPEN